MAQNNSDITPAILLQHILAMRGDLTGQIQSVEKNLSARLTKVETRLEHVETRLTTVEHKVDILTVGVDAIDQRLDTIEIEKLPKRVKVLEHAIGIAA